MEFTAFFVKDIQPGIYTLIFSVNGAKPSTYTLFGWYPWPSLL